jgi:putative addiction module component (TIGR02574 family)
MRAATRNAIFKLPRDERIRLAHELLDSIAFESAEPQFSPGQVAELKRRMKYQEMHPDRWISFEQFKKKHTKQR